MSKFLDLFPNPLKAVQAPLDFFKKREGQPFLQGSARNVGHDLFGDTVGNYVDQHFLGDPAPGQLGPVQGMASTVQPQATLDQSKQANIQQLLEQLMKAKGGVR